MATAGNNAFLRIVSSPQPDNVVDVRGSGTEALSYNNFIDEDLNVTSYGDASIKFNTGPNVPGPQTRMEITKDGEIIFYGEVIGLAPTLQAVTEAGASTNQTVTFSNVTAGFVCNSNAYMVNINPLDPVNDIPLIQLNSSDVVNTGDSSGTISLNATLTGTLGGVNNLYLASNTITIAGEPSSYYTFPRIEMYDTTVNTGLSSLGVSNLFSSNKVAGINSNFGTLTNPGAICTDILDNTWVLNDGGDEVVCFVSETPTTITGFSGATFLINKVQDFAWVSYGQFLQCVDTTAKVGDPIDVGFVITCMCDLSDSPSIILGSADKIILFNTETNAVTTLPNIGYTPTSIIYNIGINKTFFTVASFQGIYAYNIATVTSTPYTTGFDEDVSFVSTDRGQCILCRGQNKFYLFEIGALSVIYTSDSFLTGPGYIYGDYNNIFITDTGAGTITQYLNYMMPKYITTINVTSPTFGTFSDDYTIMIVTSTTIDVITFDNVQPIEISSNVIVNENLTVNESITCQYINTQIFNLSTEQEQNVNCFSSQWNNYNCTLCLNSQSTSVSIKIGNNGTPTSTVWNYNYSNIVCSYDNGTYNADTTPMTVYGGRGNGSPLYIGGSSEYDFLNDVFEFTIYNPYNNKSTGIKSFNQYYQGDGGGNYIVNGYLNNNGAESFNSLFLYFGNTIDPGATLSIRGFN
jgi:hypothetical protein